MKNISLNNKTKLFLGPLALLVAMLTILALLLAPTRAELTNPEENLIVSLSPQNEITSYPVSYIKIEEPSEVALNTEVTTTIVEDNTTEAQETASPVIVEPEVKQEVSVTPTRDFIDPLLGCDYTFTRDFTSSHFGIDMHSLNETCKINAVASGTVVSAEWGNNGQGYYIVIDHGNNIFSEYEHGNGVFYVNVGDSVSQGQEIMEMGCSGFCTGKHLHLTIREGASNLNPRDYVTFK